jgi:uncharacterized membrane protein YbhN (UPF0104 family)
MDLRPVFDAFYDRLLLRDVAGKVVPGCILILTLVASAFGFEAALTHLPKVGFTLWVVLFGLAWLVGFALQYVGESFRLLRTHPRDTDAKHSGESAAWNDRRSFYPWFAEFCTHATPEQKMSAERINVIREACGNAAVSLFLSCLIFLLCHWQTEDLPLFPALLIVVITLGVSFSLWRMHVIHVDRYGEFIKRSVNFRKENAD